MDAWVDEAMRLGKTKHFCHLFGSRFFEVESPALFPSSVLVTWLHSLTLSSTLLSTFPTPWLPTPSLTCLLGCAWGHFPLLLFCP